LFKEIRTEHLVDGEDGDFQTIVCKTKFRANPSIQSETENW